VPYPLSGIIASRLVAALAVKWLGNANFASALNKSLPGNVTSEMGLAIGDLADLARKSPEVARIIEDESDRVAGNNGVAGAVGEADAPGKLRERLLAADGGREYIAAWDRFMERYGMRCPGEIDLTRERWRDYPAALLPAIAGHMRSVEAGEHRAKFAQGAAEAEEAARSLLTDLRKQPFGWWKQRVMSRLVHVFRDFMGLREHPKYLLVRMLGLFRNGLLEEGDRLKQAGIVDRKDDVFFLTLNELRGLLEDLEQGRDLSGRRIAETVTARKADYERYCKLKPPRLMTSAGEIIQGRLGAKDAPEGALVGTPVSAGVVEGVARIVLNPQGAKLDKGEIMVAPMTDPGWTPLFQSAIGLVMEVGGLMTHGAVVAREYGLPAVVGVDGATERIKDGDRLRLDGTRGFVQILAKDNTGQDAAD
jgi:pyruvate,water dikinase